MWKSIKAASQFVRRVINPCQYNLLCGWLVTWPRPSQVTERSRR